MDPEVRQQMLDAGPRVQQAPSSFPIFKDGDVLIMISTSLRYQLHGEILKDISPVLTSLLAGEYSATLSKKAVKGGMTIRSRLTAVRNLSNEGPRWILQPVKLDKEGRLPPDAPLASLEYEQVRGRDPTHAAYDNIFRAIYGRPVDLGDWQDDGLDEILIKASEMVDLADYLQLERGGLQITETIGATLLACGQKLFRAVAEQPAAWLQFAYRIESKPIFREALIHAVGKYNHTSVQDALRSGSIGKPVANILNRKGMQLKNVIMRKQRDMLSYYPTQMHRIDDGTGRVDVSRASYSNDVFWWMAMSIYRAWISDKLAIGATHDGQDMGFALMSLINRGGDAYLGREQLTHFTRIFCLTGKGYTVIEDHLDHFKSHAKLHHAENLFDTTTCQLDIKIYPVGHFTCTTVGAEDYPFGPTAKGYDDSEGGDDVTDDESGTDSEHAGDAADG